MLVCYMPLATPAYAFGNQLLRPSLRYLSAEKQPCDSRRSPCWSGGEDRGLTPSTRAKNSTFASAVKTAVSGAWQPYKQKIDITEFYSPAVGKVIVKTSVNHLLKADDIINIRNTQKWSGRYVVETIIDEKLKTYFFYRKTRFFDTFFFT